MSASNSPTAGPPRSASTGGAWLGVGVAVRAAFVVFTSVIILGTVALIPVLVDWVARTVEQQAGSTDVPPPFAKLLDLWLEMASILHPYAIAVGLCGACLGVVLFGAAFGLVRGSDLARRAARVLLVADAILTAGATAWIVHLSFTRLEEWTVRYLATFKEFTQAMPNGRVALTFDIEGAAWMNAAFYVLLAVIALAITGTLYWLAGKPFARDWCAARSSQSR